MLDIISSWWLPLQSEMWLGGYRCHILFSFIVCPMAGITPCVHAPFLANASAKARGHTGHSFVAIWIFSKSGEVCLVDTWSQSEKRACYARLPKVGKEKCKLWLVCETLLSLLSAERSISVCFPTNVLSTNKVYWVITCTNSQWEIRCWNIVLRLESGYALVITLLQS